MVTYLFSFPQRYIPDFVSIRQVQLLYINRFYATVITNSQPGYYSIFNIAKLQGTTKRHTTIYEVIYTLFTVFETYRTFTKFSLQQKDTLCNRYFYMYDDILTRPIATKKDSNPQPKPFIQID